MNIHSAKIKARLTYSKLTELMKNYTKGLLYEAGSEGLEYKDVAAAFSLYVDKPRILAHHVLSELIKGEVREFKPEGSKNVRYRLDNVSRRFFYSREDAKDLKRIRKIREGQKD